MIGSPHVPERVVVVVRFGSACWSTRSGHIGMLGFDDLLRSGSTYESVTSAHGTRVGGHGVSDLKTLPMTAEWLQ